MIGTAHIPATKASASAAPSARASVYAYYYRPGTGPI